MVSACLLAAHLALAAPAPAAPAAYAVGIDLLGRGQVARAIAKLSTCRKNPLCARGLAIAYTKLGKPKKALRWYERSLARRPAPADADRVRRAICALRGEPCAELNRPPPAPAVYRARLARR